MAGVEQTVVGGGLPESSTPKMQRTNGLAVGMERLADKVNGQVVVVVDGVESNGRKALGSSAPADGLLQNRIGHRKTASNASTSSFTRNGNSSECSSGASCSSHEVSLYSQDGSCADTVSLPLHNTDTDTLRARIHARTVSDPNFRLTVSQEGDDSDHAQTLARLLEEVVNLKMVVIKLQEENKELKKSRNEMDDELHQLTENLFEEAYKMVDEAKGGRVNAEKRLADAAGQIEAMETKVSTLTNLLHTPHSSPHKHRKHSVKKLVKRITKHALPQSTSSSPAVSKKKALSTPLAIEEHKGTRTADSQLREGELMSDEFAEFQKWMEAGCPLSPGPVVFINRVHTHEVSPCLAFKNAKLSQKLQKAVLENAVVIEALSNVSLDEAAMTEPCALTGESKHTCSYRIRVDDSGTWHYISSNARARIVTVCDFYTFVGYIQKGIIKKEAPDLFWKIARHRAAMNIARLNLSFADV